MDIWLIIWIVLAAVLIISEILTTSFFLLWFGIGSAVAAVIAAVKGPVWLQWVAFVVISAILVAVTRRIAHRVTRGTPSTVGPDRLLGAPGIVTEAVDNTAGSGRVRVEQDDWRATAESGAPIPEGTQVTVLRVEGTRVIVRPASESES